MASKNRIVLIESNSGHRKLLGFNLDVYVGCDVVFKHNADAAINFLKENPDIRLLVSEERVGKEQTILKNPLSHRFRQTQYPDSSVRSLPKTDWEGGDV